ncbi:MAG TPA: TetR/AcrR family transcriptional regulator [Rectinemataceae bacterium]|nr:TetR/AcrR family transcriptional regulator [Rectinemataceae bacterium]
MTTEIISRDPEWPYSKAKTAVLTAAASVICESGPRAATLKNIAGRAGITEPAIFRHFEGVDGLFEGLFHAYERVYRRFDEAYHGDERGLARLRTALLSIMDYFAASREFAYILLHAQSVFRGYADLKRKTVEYSAKDRANAVACIAEGIDRGEIRGDADPQSMAVSVLGAMSMTVMTWIESSFSFDLRELAERRWDDIEVLIAKPGTRRLARRKPMPAPLPTPLPAKKEAKVKAKPAALAAPAKKLGAKKLPAKPVAAKKAAPAAKKAAKKPVGPSKRK